MSANGAPPAVSAGANAAPLASNNKDPVNMRLMIIPTKDVRLK